MNRIFTKQSNDPRRSRWPLPPPYVMGKRFRDRFAEREILSPLEIDDVRRITPEEEINLFRQLHFCAHKMRNLYRSANNYQRKRKYLRLLTRYNRLREFLVKCNVGLVYGILSKKDFYYLDKDDIVSDGMFTLLKSIDSFDPDRGFRFSTYACNSIMRALFRSSRMRMRDSHFSWDEQFDKADNTIERNKNDNGYYVERLKHILDNDIADLSDREKYVVKQRFLVEDTETLDEVGETLKCSKELVRKMQLSALGKIRNILQSEQILTTVAV